MESILGRTPTANLKSRITLLSVAGTTDTINQHVNETIIDTKKDRFPRVIVAKDGWNRFNNFSDVSFRDRAYQRLQRPGEHIWTKSWLRYILGRNAVISMVNMSSLARTDFKLMIDVYDSLILPGGNTFQLYKGIKQHKDIIQNSVESGNISYIGESAGSILAGRHTFPALIPPADICPSGVDLTESLKLIDSNVIVHAEGSSSTSTIPVIGKIAEIVLKNCITNQEDINRYINSFRSSSDSTIILRDDQAARFQSGKLRII